MIGIDNHLPANVILIGRVLVVILGRKPSALLCDNLAPATRTTVNTGVGRNISGLVFLVELTVVALRDFFAVLVDGHGGPSLLFGDQAYS